MNPQLNKLLDLAERRGVVYCPETGQYCLKYILHRAENPANIDLVILLLVNGLCIKPSQIHKDLEECVWLFSIHDNVNDIFSKIVETLEVLRK